MQALRLSSFRPSVSLILAAAFIAAVPGPASASLGQGELTIANGCLRSREVLKLPPGIRLSDLKPDGKVALERVTVCVERAPICSAEQAGAGLCSSG